MWLFTIIETKRYLTDFSGSCYLASKSMHDVTKIVPIVQKSLVFSEAVHNRNTLHEDQDPTKGIFVLEPKNFKICTMMKRKKHI